MKDRRGKKGRGKRKILHLIEAVNQGGCESFLLRVLPRMSKTFEHRILTLTGRGELAEDFEKVGVGVDETNWFGLLKKIKGFDPDVVITYLFRADVAGRLLVKPLTGYKVVPFLRTNYNYSRYWLPRLFERLTHFMVDDYLVNSESVKEYLENLGVESGRIKVVTNGLDVRVFEKARRERQKTRRSLGVVGKEVVICCVANFHPNKGHVYLLKAFEQVCKKNKKIKLFLVGDGEDRRKMEELVKDFESKEKIVFLGKRKDVPAILTASDIFALATFFEGMSNAVLEAMASGLAIVTTNIAENKELLFDKKSALLVKPGSTKGIYEALMQLLRSESLRVSLGGVASGQIRQRFDIELVARELTGFLGSV